MTSWPHLLLLYIYLHMLVASGLQFIRALTGKCIHCWLCGVWPSWETGSFEQDSPINSALIWNLYYSSNHPWSQVAKYKSILRHLQNHNAALVWKKRIHTGWVQRMNPGCVPAQCNIWVYSFQNAILHLSCAICNARYVKPCKHLVMITELRNSKNWSTSKLCT